MADAVVETRNLRFAYPGSEELARRCPGHRPAAVDGIDLEVRRGERLAILGANGSGKSTLLLLLNGTLRPIGGTVYLKGRAVNYSRNGLTVWRQTVGLVFQDPDDQIFAPTVFQDVSYGPLNLGMPEEDVRRRTEETLDFLGIADLAGSPVHLLSWGQRKLTAIAGVIAMHPEVLILDEPTAGLDARGVAQLMELLERLALRGTTVILALHDTDAALAWADAVVVLSRGQLIGRGKPEAILSDSSILVAANLKEPGVLEGWRVAKEMVRGLSGLPPRTMEELIRWMAAGFGERISADPIETVCKSTNSPERIVV
jgi:cobalt/nickel transport system ATP-binding protein